MQRVSSLLPSWERTRLAVDSGGANSNNTSASNTPTTPATASGAFSKVFGWADRISTARLSGSNPASSTSLTTQSHYGKETYWPTSLEKECEKAARILKSFCSDGFLSYESDASLESLAASPNPAAQVQMMKKVPPRIVQNAVGLAIFSCMRSGLWMSGSGGSGILIARKADGTWSPPSGILLHTAALGFVIGVDIYDCVLVINSVAALETFTRSSKVMLGADLGLTVGPVVPLGLLENENTRWKELNNSVLTYLKARGQHRAVQLDGSLVTERSNENEKFYGASVQVLDILAGNVRKDIPEISPLFEAIKAAEGRTDFDVAAMQALASQPAPGDAMIESSYITPISPTRSTFGLPDADDPDPFGIIALEMAGLEIREAGTTSRHRTSTQPDCTPNPASPVFSTFHRQSIDTFLSNSNRGSYMSSRTQATAMTDAFTQTDTGDSARTTSSSLRLGASDAKKTHLRTSSSVIPEPEEIDYTKIDMSPLESLRFDGDFDATMPDLHQAFQEPSQALSVSFADAAAAAAADYNNNNNNNDDDDISSIMLPEDEQERDGDADDEDDESEDEEPIVFEVATASQPTRAVIMATQAAQLVSAKGALVTIPRRVAPVVPERNPARSSQRISKIDLSPSLQSSTRSSFDSSSRCNAPVVDPALVALPEDSDDDLVPTMLASRPETPLGSTMENSTSACADADYGHISTSRYANEASSSAEDEYLGEPQTPKAEDDFDRKRTSLDHQTKHTPNFNTAAIEVL